MYVSYSDLTKFCTQILTALDVPAAHAELVSNSLATANLRGVDSHGVQMLLPYMEQLDAGSMDPVTKGSITSESGACVIYDGQNGIGQVVADRCTEEALRVVQQCGLALVIARNSNHFGAAAYWGRKLTDSGQIGIVMTNASAAVPPWQGKAARIGTNPICVAVPGDTSETWLLDMATTTVSLGKIYEAFYRGETSIPSGWALDVDGKSTTDTQAALSGFPMPLGGYKGSGLGLMVEILTAALGGARMSTDVGSLRVKERPLSVSHAFLVIDPDRFIGLAKFKLAVSRLTSMIKSTPPATGYEEVLIAGEPEWRAEKRRLREGIPLPGKLLEEFQRAADRLNVHPLPTKDGSDFPLATPEEPK